MMAQSKQIQFLKGSTILIISNLVIKGINFFLLPLYTKYLTPEALGVSDTIVSLTSMIFPLLVMGLDSAFSAFYFDERSEEHQKRVFNTICCTLMLVSIIPIVFILFSQIISVFLFNTDKYDILVSIAFLSVSMNLWYLPFSIIVRMKNKMLLFAIVNFIASISMIGLNIVFLSVVHLGVYSLILTTAIINLLQFCLYLKFSGSKIEKTFFNKKLIQKMLKYSLPLVPNVVALWILNMSDRYIILYFCGEGDVGLYGIAARFATMVSFIANGVYMSYTTYVYDKKDDADAPKQYARILNAFNLIILIICIIGSIFGKEVIGIMTDEAYYESYLMLAPLLFSQLLYGINTIVGYAIGFAKKSYYTLLSTSVGAIINVILNIIFIPKFGAVAAAYTTCVSFAIMVVITYLISQKLYYVEYGIKKMTIIIICTFVISVFVKDINIVMKIIFAVIVIISLLLSYKKIVMDCIIIIKRILNRR
ncbi:MAG: lipopolysaccharide biosynthesis protein [Anaerovoracaceae bacterium]